MLTFQAVPINWQKSWEDFLIHIVIVCRPTGTCVINYKQTLCREVMECLVHLDWMEDPEKSDLKDLQYVCVSSNIRTLLPAKRLVRMLSRYNDIT